ncbi:uncharacterized protein PG986_011812 [Apiospora aurea]|uniref:CST complex subunit Stn1 N-terminal domain-containing protein n=1 Tax=Apiospora aurea TaxID=335848 RepID=A0ABR1PYM1_9PEZI
MTSATGTTKDSGTDNSDKKYEFYPEYCNAVSPTINKWCPLTAQHIHDLSWKVRIDNQKYVFFHLNHPIYWVRIVGVVVAIDSFYSRRIYTIDDSSGACIECCVTLPPPEKTTSAPTTTNTTTATNSNNNNSNSNSNSNPLLPPPPPDPYPGIETGLVVEVKGALTLFRNQPQIDVTKMAHLRSTSAEVAFWGKIRAFREGMLASPWFVDAGTARRLKRENEKDVVRRNRREERERRERQQQQRLVGGRSGGGRVDSKKSSTTATSAYDEERRKRSRRDEANTSRDHTRDPRRQKREGGERRSSRRKTDDDADQEEATSEQPERRSERHREDGKNGWEGKPSLRHKPQRPSKLSEVATYTEGKYDALGL